MRIYRHRHVKELFESRYLNPRSIINLVEKGVVEPLTEPENQGGKREYSHKNVVELLIAGECLYFGLPIKKIGHILHHLDVQAVLSVAENSDNKIGYKFIIFYRHHIHRHKGIKGQSHIQNIGVVPAKGFKIDMNKRSSGLFINVGELNQFIENMAG